MEHSREDLEKLLKIVMEKLRQKLGFDKFDTNDYVVKLNDSINGEAHFISGTPVTVIVQTSRFVEAINRAQERKVLEIKVRTQNEIDFQDLLESCLRTIPRMFNTLAHPAKAHASIIKRNESNRLSRYYLSKDDYDAEHRHYTQEHPLSRETHFALDYRCTAIHWKSGTVVREFGNDKKAAEIKAANKIYKLLEDKDIYNRTEAGFQYIEPHDDLIYDLISDAKVLNKDEIAVLIQKLQEEYLT